MARLRDWSAVRLATWLGSKRGTLAIASTSPVLRIERHQRAGLGAGLVHGALELLFGDALQRGVDGQLDVCAGARERPPPLTHHELPPPRVVPDDQGLHLTPQLRIEGTLDALQALAVDAREPEHLRRPAAPCG